jgi:hypothetical protein
MLVMTALAVTGLARPARAQDQAPPGMSYPPGTDVSPGADVPPDMNVPPAADVAAGTDVAPVEGGDVELGTFDDTLSPYGTWVNVGGLGQVWRPSPALVGADFRPYYSGGHWVYTDAGWTFVSDYSWGWATFHYGHWWFDPSYGWVWVPGTHWAPAWVDWRYGGDYVGWAPEPPPGFTLALTAAWGTPWCFVPTAYVAYPSFRNYVVPVGRVRPIYEATRPAPVAVVRPGVRYSPGPPASHFQAAGVHLQPVAVSKVTHAVPPPTAHARPVVTRAANPVVPNPGKTVPEAQQQRTIQAARPATPPSSHGALTQHAAQAAPQRAAQPPPQHAAQPPPQRAAQPPPHAQPPAEHAAPQPHPSAPPPAHAAQQPPQHATQPQHAARPSAPPSHPPPAQGRPPPHAAPPPQPKGEHP